MQKGADCLGTVRDKSILCRRGYGGDQVGGKGGKGGKGRVLGLRAGGTRVSAPACVSSPSRMREKRATPWAVSSTTCTTKVHHPNRGKTNLIQKTFNNKAVLASVHPFADLRQSAHWLGLQTVQGYGQYGRGSAHQLASLPPPVCAKSVPRPWPGWGLRVEGGGVAGKA